MCILTFSPFTSINSPRYYTNMTFSLLTNNSLKQKWPKGEYIFTAEDPLVLIGSELLVSASSCQFCVQHEWAGQWSDCGRSVPSLGFPWQVFYDTAHIYISNTSENNAFQLPQTPEDDWKWEVSHNCWSLGPNAQNIHLQSSSKPVSEDVFYSEYKRMWQWALGLFVQVYIDEKKVGDL